MTEFQWTGLRRWETQVMYIHKLRVCLNISATFLSSSELFSMLGKRLTCQHSLKISSWQSAEKVTENVQQLVEQNTLDCQTRYTKNLCWFRGLCQRSKTIDIYHTKIQFWALQAKENQDWIREEQRICMLLAHTGQSRGSLLLQVSPSSSCRRRRRRGSVCVSAAADRLSVSQNLGGRPGPSSQENFGTLGLPASLAQHSLRFAQRQVTQSTRKQIEHLPISSFCWPIKFIFHTYFMGTEGIIVAH